MFQYLKTFFTYLGALGVIATSAFLLVEVQRSPPIETRTPRTEESQVASVSSTDTVESAGEKPVVREKITEIIPIEERTPPSEISSDTPPPASTEITSDQSTTFVKRTLNPYSSPPEALLALNDAVRSALVNILCTTSEQGIHSISGSGVIIDPRGVVLTNAHVAQYILLAQSGRTNISCVIRSGTPARALWGAEILYMPRVWVEENAADITKTHATGTGEHDYALVRITKPIEPNTPLPQAFHAIPVDTREAIAFQNDFVLSASYPSEFLGGVATKFDLNPLTASGSVEELLTFHTGTVDLISLGGVPGAQSGSSGGGAINAWGYLVGIITTTSEGATTAERELRAITLSYINRDILEQTGSTLAEILNKDIVSVASDFRDQTAPSLVELLIAQIRERSLR